MSIVYKTVQFQFLNYVMFEREIIIIDYKMLYK